jgi:hypothetical protein
LRGREDGDAFSAEQYFQNQQAAGWRAAGADCRLFVLSDACQLGGRSPKQFTQALDLDDLGPQGFVAGFVVDQLLQGNVVALNRY